MSERARLAAPGSPAQLTALVRDPEFEPGCAWVENGNEAAFIIANAQGALDEEPERMEAQLPDGRTIAVAAAAVALRFERTRRGWRPILLQGVRVRSVELGDETLFYAEDLTEETVQFLPDW
jgi:hypothetical protein